MPSVNGSPPGTFQRHVEDMRNLLYCNICFRPFYEPFILGCGHTRCYSCLASCFSSAPDGRRHRECPDCRAVVTVQPSPNYLLRNVVHMLISRVELLPEDETVEEHRTAAREEADLLGADRTGPGLFRGVFARGDNVPRCPECQGQLEEGECLQCGFRESEPGGEGLSDSNDNISDNTSFATIQEESDGIEIEIERLRQEHGARPSQRIPRTPIRIVISDEDAGTEHGASSGLDGTTDGDSDQDETEDGESLSDESGDAAMQPPRSTARRLQHLQSRRARRPGTARTPFSGRRATRNRLLQGINSRMRELEAFIATGVR
ncbi:uncharacterized protein A1O9_13046 [Exophiala aquamarina CBS 119918]|uniref:RING-type domain-containing protein n=1 Tax=Exophiala aquamarina CBS 119918 TaxID=1182545 RepID=A0A072NU56_9EURO|nr:uncharacterized protein A1O9_13046 [Exophiala aquamarina CBS 119918]KEF50897.1 hypothetical protein A1O9_13046 [Exophiala aquamarina CBS 119918]